MTELDPVEEVVRDCQELRKLDVRVPTDEQVRQRTDEVRDLYANGMRVSDITDYLTSLL